MEKFQFILDEIWWNIKIINISQIINQSVKQSLFTNLIMMNKKKMSIHNL